MLYHDETIMVSRSFDLLFFSTIRQQPSAYFFFPRFFFTGFSGS